mgnify:CR=1 FL=1
MTTHHLLEHWLAQERDILTRLDAGPGPGVARREQIAHMTGLEQMQAMLRGELPQGWDAALPSFTSADKGKATRQHSYDALNAFGPKLPELIGVPILTYPLVALGLAIILPDALPGLIAATQSELRLRIAELEAAHPRVKFKLVSTAIDEIRASFSSSMAMLWEGAALAVLVVWFFLRDWRATWISALALPLSIIPTFGVIWLLGFSLNMITLLALAVVVGILVDDAIVEVENIDRHLAMGKSPKVAATEAADEIGLAVIATSATLAAVFIPVAFMPGIAGKFFLEFGWTAATAVIFSLMVARLLTPMMAAYQLKAKPHVEKESKLMARYLRVVEWALANRFKTLFLALLMFIGSLALVPLIPATFIPGSDLGRSNLSLELPPGARLDQTAAMSERARALISDLPELRQAYATVGGVLDLGDPAVSGFGEVRKVTMVLDWGPEGERDRSQKELEREVRERLTALPGVRQRFLTRLGSEAAGAAGAGAARGAGAAATGAGAAATGAAWAATGARPRRSRLMRSLKSWSWISNSERSDFFIKSTTCLILIRSKVMSSVRGCPSLIQGVRGVNQPLIPEFRRESCLTYCHCVS